MPSMRQSASTDQILRVDAHEFADQHETRVHSHERHQLTYTKSGVLSVKIGSARWVVPPLRAVWIPSNVTHSILAHGTSSARLAFIDGSVNATFPTEVTVIQITPLLREVIQELCDGALIDHDRHHLEALFSLHLKRHNKTQTPSSRPLLMSELSEPRLAMIEQALRAAPSDRRTLSEWGKFCGSSERTLSRLFKSETGTTFSHWRRQLRIQHAVVQLAGGQSVTNTAHECGFNSTSAFIESFQAVLGTTPGRYFATS